jgi:histidinol-phosphate aminotransferase
VSVSEIGTVASVSEHPIGRPRTVVADLPSYRPGKGTKQAEAEHGITNAIKLASNENPSQPLDSILAAIAAAAEGINRYADHRATAVREALADRLCVGADQVTVGAGSTGILQQLFFSYVDPGDEVLYPWRSFEVYPVFTRLMSGVPVQVALRPDLAYDLPAIAAGVTDRTKLIFLATPNNPTGVAETTRDLSGMLAEVPSTVIVVIDEAYREFVDPAFGDPIVDLLPDFPNLIVTRTFSKAHGLAGLRVGYAVGSPNVVATIDKTMQPFAVNALAQSAALAALEPDADAAIQARVAGLLSERARVVGALRTAGWAFPEPQGNFVYLTTGERTDQIGLAMEQRGVVVRPFSGEGVRVTIGSSAENDRFLSTLAEVAQP